jgi:hypothetical protein
VEVFLPIGHPTIFALK